MKPWVLGVVLLIIGLIVGLGLGGVAFAGTTTVTKYETVTATSLVTSITTATLEKIFEKTITSTVPTTVTQTQKVTEKVVSTVTLWPKFAPEGKIGEEVGEKGLVFVVYGVEERWKLGIFDPQPGNKFIVLDIEIKNVYPEEKSVGAAWFYVVDDKGKRYGYSLASVAITGYFPGSANLAPGESVRGYAAFEIPAESTPKYFIYEVFGERYASIALQ